MAELQHDRAPDQTAAQTSAFAGSETRAAGAVVFVRVWSNREGGQPRDSSKGLEPAVCLAVDLIAASGGAVQQPGKSLFATFPDAPTAILAARRMQWAFQGFSEADGFAGTGIAALVYSSEDLSGKPASDSDALPLERATPGKVMLGQKVTELLRDLPGLATEPATDSVLSEFIWRSSESGSGNADELTLFRNIKEQRRRTGEHAAEESPPVPGESPEAVFAVSAELAEPENPFPDTPAGGFFARLSNAHRLMLGGGAVVLACVVGFAAIALIRHPAAPIPASSISQAVSVPVVPQSAAPQVQSTAAQSAPVATVRTPVKIETPAAKPAEAESSRDRAKKQHENAAKEVPAAGGCDVGAAGAKRTLDRANNSLHAGKFDEAEREFKSILGCEGASAQARVGLEEVRARREAAR
jgi:hypothetical protein